MSNGDVLISLRDVTVSYPLRKGFLKWSRYTPLHNISLELRRGETVGVIGRNGAGKSTLLKLMAGIIAPDSGEVMNHGARVSLLALGVGFMPHLTGRENALLSGMLLGLRKHEIASRLDAIIEFSDLGDFIDQPLHTYSSGMRARLGFSVAIQVDPDVLLVDEILGVGDEDFRIKSSAEMKRLIKSEKTVVLVSHVLPVVKELCDRVVWIEDNVVKHVGSVEEVFDLYSSQRQAPPAARPIAAAI
ncbi:ABC transporter [Pseudomonas taiwanensis]|uniref:ABC transporter ATP-binding protein n=1 Tax=Pseudomonas taiwanensis TaxID=470150 RepID=UPI0015BD07B6|nr:ABC transporter ATP-binding protein [Pseudomonas taiwanensis]NWL76806.1 ABC transporter [Pseudomonas taiwanensis]